MTIFFLCFFIFSCNVPQKEPIQVSKNIISKKLNEEEKVNWQHRDILKDTIAGISLERATEELLNNKKGNTVVIAIIDSLMVGTLWVISKDKILSIQVWNLQEY